MRARRRRSSWPPLISSHSETKSVAAGRFEGVPLRCRSGVSEDLGDPLVNDLLSACAEVRFDRDVEAVFGHVEQERDGVADLLVGLVESAGLGIGAAVLVHLALLTGAKLHSC